MSFSNQYTVSVFPFHRDGTWRFDDLSDDQFTSPENYHGGPEDQYFLPLVPGRIYRIRYTCTPQVILSPPSSRFELIAWHDLLNFYDYAHLFCDANPPGTVVPAFGFATPPFANPGADLHPGDPNFVDESTTAFPSLDWTVGGEDQHGDATPDPTTTRVSVCCEENPDLFNPDLLPIAYSLDISIVNGGSRYRPIHRG